MKPPRSIFTGTSAEPSQTSNPETRRLSTPEYQEILAQGSGGSKPSTPLEKPSSATAPSAKQPTWPIHSSAHEQSTPRRPSVSAAKTGGGTSNSAAPVRTPPTVAGIKRPHSARPPDSTSASDTPPAEPSSEPLHKRRRLPTRSRHTLDQFSFSKTLSFKDTGQPPSPLFFSHSRRTRPQLPARFSSSEAAARMLSKTRGEESGIKTVTLARGTFSGLSPPGVTSIPSTRSSERSSLPRTSSPDGRDPLRLLGSVGIVELLEQDTRPTFIVDIDNVSNYTPGSTNLQILFANSALRSNMALWDLVSSGKSVDPMTEEPISHASNQFKGWLLSTIVQGESLDINPSPVEHGGIVWSCYTLRKRLRVVSGSISTPSASSIPSTSASNENVIQTFSAPQLPSNGFNKPIPSPTQTDPQDYFGNSVPTVTEHLVRDQSPPAAVPSESDSGSFMTAPADSIERTTRPDRLDLPTIDGYPSYTNECVLRAHAAGDVDAFHRQPSPSQDHDVGFFDWTRLSISPSLPRHIQFARSVDWAATPLGPIEFWSNDLRAMCNLIM